MKGIVARIVFALMVLAIVVWITLNIVPHHRSPTERERARTEANIRIKRAVSDMVIKHNAVVIDWEIFGEEIYTIEVEEALIRSDGRPVLFLLGDVDDIVRRDEGYFVHFKPALDIPGFGIPPEIHSLGIPPEIHFVLKCSPEQVKKIMNRPAWSFSEYLFFDNEYLVIAAISHVRRIESQPDAFIGIRGDEGISLDGWIEFQSDVFIASGDCLDLLFVRDFEKRE